MGTGGLDLGKLPNLRWRRKICAIALQLVCVFCAHAGVGQPEARPGGPVDSTNAPEPTPDSLGLPGQLHDQVRSSSFDSTLAVLPYDGEFPAPRVEAVRARVRPLIAEAIANAESLLQMQIDPSRVRFLLTDIPRNSTATILRMYTRGKEKLTIGIHVQPVLRGDYRNDAAILISLTHEVIHAIVRQRMTPEAYSSLPDWFQEGLPTLLLGQGQEKLVSALALNQGNPMKVLEYFEGTHVSEPYITGVCALSVIERRTNDPRVMRFTRAVLEESSIPAALQKAGLSEETLWSEASRRASMQIQGLTEDVGPKLQSCSRLYDQGSTARRECARCYRDLTETYSDSWAGQLAQYWLARCLFKMEKYDESRVWFQRFESSPLTFGLLDNARYFQLRILQIDEQKPEAEVACREYLDLFPDGDNWARAKRLCADPDSETDDDEAER